MFGKDWKDVVEGCVTPDGVATLKCIPAVMQNVIGFALLASGIVAVFFIIWGGARYVTSAGDQKRIDAARKTLMWAIIGLILILLSFFIVNFVGVLTGTEDCINKVGFDNPEC
jgi:hypothetical protein